MLTPNLLYTYMLNIYDLVWLRLWYINQCRQFKTKFPTLSFSLSLSIYIYIYILGAFGLVWFGLVLWPINYCRQFFFLLVKLATPFSIATTPRCSGGHFSISWNPWSLLYSAEDWARRHQVPFLEFLVLLYRGLNLSLWDDWWTLCFMAYQPL